MVILATPCMHEDAKLRALAHSLGPHIAGKVPVGQAVLCCAVCARLWLGHC